MNGESGASRSTRRALVVDNDSEVRVLVADLLAEQGLDVLTAEDGDVALDRIRVEPPPAVVLLDLDMPRMGGMEVLRHLRESRSTTPVIILTADDDIAKVVEAMRLGAYDYLTKPFRNDDLLLRVRHALERQALLEEVGALRADAASASVRDQMGPSPAIQRVGQQVALVAGSDFSVLVEGETGSGKEIVARAIHQQSARRARPFVAVDCGAVPESLFESELFGFEKGAFTGAERRKDGYFKRADGGTLFLDEVTNLPSPLQGKLLRALQEHEIQPLGATRPTTVDVRVIAASNVSAADEVTAGRFRADLFYRLNEFALRVPSLRERTDDIPHLARRFVDEVAMELRRPGLEISEETVALLVRHHWPGNVRELRNAVRRAALLAMERIEPEHLVLLGTDAPPERAAAAPGRRSERSLREIAEAASSHAEQEAIRQALEATGGNKTEAARLLKVDYKTLYLKLKRYGAGKDGSPRDLA